MAKGLAILEAFERSRVGRLSIAEAAQLTGQDRSTARRCLLTLVDLGYLRFDGKYFWPEVQLLRLAAAYLLNARIPQVAQSLLDQIRSELNEAVSLSIPDGDEVVVVARSWTSHILLTGAAVGTRVPAYCSAAGQIWLASLSDKELDAYLARVPLLPRTSRTIVDPTVLRSRIEDVRRSGYCLGEEEFEEGFAAVAVPIIKPNSVFVGALVVSSALSRKSSQELLAIAYPHLSQASRILGRAV